MKKILFSLCFLFSLLGIVWTAFCQSEDWDRMDNSIFEDPKRPGVLFSHDEHNELAEIEDCSVCHHVIDEDGQVVEGESSEDNACADCHELQASEYNSVALMNAYHRLCRDCHFSSKKGPVMCGQCHKKE